MQRVPQNTSPKSKNTPAPDFQSGDLRNPAFELNFFLPPKRLVSKNSVSEGGKKNYPFTMVMGKNG